MYLIFVTKDNTQYTPLKTSDALKLVNGSTANFAKDQLNRPSFDKDGTKGGGFYYGLIQDATKAIGNYLLEGQAKDVISIEKRGS